MIRLFQFIRKYHYPILFILLEIIGFIILTSSSPFHQSKLNYAFQEVNGSIFRQIASVRSYFRLHQVADSLMAENARLRELVYASGEEPANDSIVIDTVKKLQYRLKTAKIINNTLSGSNNFIIIDKGRKDSIHEQMGVMSTSGIAGVLMQVSENYSLALSVLSKKFRVNAKILETGELGSLTWDGKSPKYMILTDIPNQIKIAKGQHVVVGPYSRYFPENTPVGVIEDFDVSSNSSLLDIKVRLYDNIKNLKRVFLIENTDWLELELLEKQFSDEK
ncbi:MAG: rod shape-determining protein MreC [Sphingobacteriales bacterium]|nr:rod shape-determining protein MreC [Sphingobacteriales bacterium]